MAVFVLLLNTTHTRRSGTVHGLLFHRVSCSNPTHTHLFCEQILLSECFFKEQKSRSSSKWCVVFYFVLRICSDYNGLVNCPGWTQLQWPLRPREGVSSRYWIDDHTCIETCGSKIKIRLETVFISSQYNLNVAALEIDYFSKAQRVKLNLNVVYRAIITTLQSFPKWIYLVLVKKTASFLLLCVFIHGLILMQCKKKQKKTFSLIYHG